MKWLDVAKLHFWTAVYLIFSPVFLYFDPSLWLLLFVAIVNVLVLVYLVSFSVLLNEMEKEIMDEINYRDL